MIMTEEEMDEQLELYEEINNNNDNNDNVNHPSHYNDGKIEVIDYIENANLGFHLGNAIKYISRAGKKDSADYREDLKKATWYIKRYCKSVDSGNNFEITEEYIKDKKFIGMTANVVRLIACLMYKDVKEFEIYGN